MNCGAKFEKWAPTPVIQEWKEKVAELDDRQAKYPNAEVDTKEADSLLRLLTYSDMREVWERLPKYEIKPQVFSSMVQLSLCFLTSEPHNMTEKEHVKWLCDVKATAAKLRGLIQLTNYDSIFVSEYYRKRQIDLIGAVAKHALQVIRPDVDPEEHAKQVPPYESWPDLQPALLSEVLQKIVNSENEDDFGLYGQKSEPTVRLDKPNHPNAARSYFIRKLTQLLRRDTGKPLRKIVTITTAAVFDDCTLTERQIIRIAP